MNYEIKETKIRLPIYWASYLANGDGSGLEGVASAGLGTAVADSGAGKEIYYVNKTLDIASDTTITVPTTSTSNVAYTNYQEIEVADTKNLTIADGDDLLVDVLRLGEI